MQAAAAPAALLCSLACEPVAAPGGCSDHGPSASIADGGDCGMMPAGVALLARAEWARATADAATAQDVAEANHVFGGPDGDLADIWNSPRPPSAEPRSLHLILRL